jgi:iron(III) transport system permease protein
VTRIQIADGPAASSRPEGAAGPRPRTFQALRRPDRPLGLLVLAALVAAAVILPLVFVLLEAKNSGISTVAHLIDRPLTAQLLWNTVRLTAVVTVLCAVIGTGAAWLVERTDLPGRRVWAVLVVVPLAIPDFVVSFG